jgi:hypothetical protein
VSCEEIDILPRIARSVTLCSIAAAGARRAFDLTRFPQKLVSVPDRFRTDTRRKTLSPGF